MYLSDINNLQQKEKTSLKSYCEKNPTVFVKNVRSQITCKSPHFA